MQNANAIVSLAETGTLLVLLHVCCSGAQNFKAGKLHGDPSFVPVLSVQLVHVLVAALRSAMPVLLYVCEHDTISSVMGG